MLVLVQEDPGESLSDCEKDEEILEEEGSKVDEEDESEDGFFVPDGYLSENEVPQLLFSLILFYFFYREKMLCCNND